MDLKNAGFAVEGRGLRYVVGYQTGLTCGTAAAYLAAAPNAPVEGARVQSVSTGVSSPSTIWVGAVYGTDLSSSVLSGTNCSSTAFTAKALGDPSNPSSALSAASDTWSIDQDKALKNLVMGY